MAKKLKAKEKKIVKIILLLIVILTILVITLNYFNKLQTEKEMEEQRKAFQEFRAEYESQTILPRNIMELYNYKGYYDRDYLYKNMKQFIDYISYLNENISVDNVNNFYQEKSQEILTTLGIDNQEYFQIFLNKVKNKNLSVNDFNYAEIETDSSYNKKGYFHFGLYLYYNNTPVKFKVAFSQEKREEKIISYEFAD